MATYQSTHTGAEIDAGIDLLDKNNATEGQVLTANGTGGATWEDVKNEFYLHTIVTSAYTFYVVNKYETVYTANNLQGRTLLDSIAFNRYIGYSLQNRLYAYDIAIAIAGDFGDLTNHRDSPNIIQKGNAISYFGRDGQEVTILSSNFGTFVSDTVTKTAWF